MFNQKIKKKKPQPSSLNQLYDQQPSFRLKKSFPFRFPKNSFVVATKQASNHTQTHIVSLTKSKKETSNKKQTHVPKMIQNQGLSQTYISIYINNKIEILNV